MLSPLACEAQIRVFLQKSLAWASSSMGGLRRQLSEKNNMRCLLSGRMARRISRNYCEKVQTCEPTFAKSGRGISENLARISRKAAKKSRGAERLRLFKDFRHGVVLLAHAYSRSTGSAQKGAFCPELWHRRDAKKKNEMESEGLFDNFTLDLSICPSAIVSGQI